MNRLASFFVLFTGCAGVAPASTEPAPPALEEEVLLIDYRGLFEHAFTESIYDPAVIQPGLMERVLVEPDLLSQGTHVEAWAAIQLLSWLSQHRSLVIGPPLPPELETRAPCETGGCFETPPTAVLRGVRFFSGTDQVKVAVTRNETAVLVLIRRAFEGESLCPDDFQLPLGHMQLSLQVQRLTDGALAGLVRETRLLASPTKPAIEASLPAYDDSPDAFCQALARVYEDAPELENTDWQYMLTAHAMLDSALSPLFPRPE